MYKKLKNQITYTASYKVIILILNYVYIALIMNYLGQDDFGVFIALTSLFSWMFLFDLGIAKGMRNYVTIALSNNNLEEARDYISTTYIITFFLSLISASIILFLLFFIDLKEFFNLNIKNLYLYKILIILIIGFFLKFYFSIVDQLNFATHKSHNVSLNLLLVAILNFLGILILVKFFSSEKIINLIYVFSLALVLPYLYSTILFFREHKKLIPSVKFYSKKVLNNILGQGSKILFIQIGFLLMIGVDRLILLKYGSALEVAKYEIVYKIMSIVIFPASIILAPLWSSFTDAYHNNDISWIKEVFKKFYFLILLLFIIVIILTFSFNSITQLWLDDFSYIEYHVIFTMGILMLSLIWSNFHTDFLLGIQRLSNIMYIVIIGLFIKFAYIYYIFSINQTLTLIDLVLSSLLAYSLYNFIIPFYIKNLLQKKS